MLNPDADTQYVRLGRTFQTDPAHPGDPPLTDSTVWNLPVDVYVEELQDGIPVKRYQFDPCAAPVKDTSQDL